MRWKLDNTQQERRKTPYIAFAEEKNPILA
jgi:hypothetical protein